MSIRVRKCGNLNCPCCIVWEGETERLQQDRLELLRVVNLLAEAIAVDMLVSKAALEAWADYQMHSEEETGQ